MNHTQSYSKNYFALSVATLIIVVVVSSIFILYTNSQREKDNYKILQTESNNISKIISDSFLHHHNLSNFIGQKILQNSTKDSVLSVLSSTDKFNSNSDLMSWTSFSWSDTQNRKMVNSKIGITDDQPINVAKRQYVKNKAVITKPWTVQISNPDVGTVSQIWVIPVGMGITDANGKFIGIVTAGFKISEFENKIQQKLSNSNVNFVVIDDEANIILQSSGNITKHDDDFYKRSDLLPKLTEKSGKIKDGIKAYDIYYTHYQKMDNYPYIILTGFNQSFLDKEFNSVILPRILELIVIIIFFLVILLPMQYTRKIHGKN